MAEQQRLRGRVAVWRPGSNAGPAAWPAGVSGFGQRAADAVRTWLSAEVVAGRLFPWMALSGPAYTRGFQGLNNTSELLGIWPTLIPRDRVQARLEMLEPSA